jgi:hypothetical protein
VNGSLEALSDRPLASYRRPGPAIGKDPTL